MYILEYSSECILIVSKEDEEIKVIYLDELNPKIVKINTYITGLDNEEIELAIKQVLDNNLYDIDYDNNLYDIDYEIKLYRQSELYQSIEEYNKE